MNDECLSINVMVQRILPIRIELDCKGQCAKKLDLLVWIPQKGICESPPILRSLDLLKDFLNPIYQGRMAWLVELLNKLFGT